MIRMMRSVSRIGEYLNRKGGDNFGRFCCMTFQSV